MNILSLTVMSFTLLIYYVPNLCSLSPPLYLYINLHPESIF